MPSIEVGPILLQVDQWVWVLCANSGLSVDVLCYKREFVRPQNNWLAVKERNLSYQHMGIEQVIRFLCHGHLVEVRNRGFPMAPLGPQLRLAKVP